MILFQEIQEGQRIPRGLSYCKSSIGLSRKVLALYLLIGDWHPRCLHFTLYIIRTLGLPWRKTEILPSVACCRSDNWGRVKCWVFPPQRLLQIMGHVKKYFAKLIKQDQKEKDQIWGNG